MGLGVILHVLDFVGLSLAFLDSLGLTGKIEAALSSFRDWVRGFVSYVREDQKALLTPKRRWRALLGGVGRDVLVIVYVGVALIIFGNGPLMLSWVEAIPRAWWWAVIMAAPITLVIIHILYTRVLVQTGLVLMSDLLWRVFWLLGRPKTGVIGTVGLLLALIGTLGGLLPEHGFA